MKFDTFLIGYKFSALLANKQKSRQYVYNMHSIKSDGFMKHTGKKQKQSAIFFFVQIYIHVNISVGQRTVTTDKKIHWILSKLTRFISKSLL